MFMLMNMLFSNMLMAATAGTCGKRGRAEVDLCVYVCGCRGEGRHADLTAAAAAPAAGSSSPPPTVATFMIHATQCNATRQRDVTAGERGGWGLGARR